MPRDENTEPLEPQKAARARIVERRYRGREAYDGWTGRQLCDYTYRPRRIEPRW